MINSNLKHELSINEKIQEAQKSIRQKTLAMKIGRNNVEQEMDFYLKPLKEPLEKIAKFNESRFKKEETSRKRLLDEAHDVLEASKKHRQRVESLSSPKSSQIENNQQERLSRRERIKNILDSPKVYLSRTSKINPAITTPSPSGTPSWDPSFDYQNLILDKNHDNSNNLVPLISISSEKNESANDQNNFNINNPVHKSIPQESLYVRDSHNKVNPDSGIQNDFKSDDLLSHEKKLEDDFHPLHMENFEKQMIEKSTPKKRESLSHLDYYLNLLNIKDDRIDNATGISLKKKGFELNRVPVKFITQPYKAIELNNGAKYRLTRGLNELLFMKQPDQGLVTNIDERNYKKIALEAMFSGDRKLATLKTSQYLAGKGIYMKDSNKTKEFVYYDDPNQLVLRLQLLWASKLSNHSGHDNEIARLEELLRKKKYIK